MSADGGRTRHYRVLFGDHAQAFDATFDTAGRVAHVDRPRVEAGHRLAAPRRLASPNVGVGRSFAYPLPDVQTTMSDVHAQLSPPPPRVPSVATCLLTAVVLLGSFATAARAQARPEAAGRIWGELGIEGARQAPSCRGCVSLGGPALTVAAGLALPQGFGVALLGRAFQAFSFDYSQGSKYVVALGQYTPPSLALLTLNAGAGWARHRGDDNGEGAVLAAGVALRLPARSRVALSVTADAMQTVGGRTSYQPQLFSVGLALSIASADATAARQR
jgi:hypothetical protein